MHHANRYSNQKIPFLTLISPMSIISYHFQKLPPECGRYGISTLPLNVLLQIFSNIALRASVFPLPRLLKPFRIVKHFSSPLSPTSTSEIQPSSLLSSSSPSDGEKKIFKVQRIASAIQVNFKKKTLLSRSRWGFVRQTTYPWP